MKNLFKSNLFWIVVMLSICIPPFYTVIKHAGILHGDECCCVNLAQMFSLSLMHSWIGFDSYGLFYPLSVREYGFVFGYTDTSLRILGFLTQLLLLFVVGKLCYENHIKPYFTLPLCLLLPVCVNFTSNIRAWGLGIVMLCLVMSAVRGDKETWKVLLISLMACHTTFYNCILLFCILLPHIIFEKRFQYIWIGMICAISMLVYSHAILNQQEHYKNLLLRFTVTNFRDRFIGDLNHGANMILLAAAFLIIILQCMFNIQKYRIELLTIALSFMCMVLFFLHMHYWTSDWYYLPLIFVFCVMMDFICGEWKKCFKFVYPIFIICILPSSFSYAQKPQSLQTESVKYLMQNANKNDLVICSPWENAIEVEYYCKTNGFELVTVPYGITNNILTRFDEEEEWFKKNPIPNITEVTNRIEKALNDGQRVFILTCHEWRYKHQKAPTLQQFTNSIPNCNKSFQYGYIEGEQLINYVQGLSRPIELITPSHGDINLFYLDNLVVINDHM